jgi:hypothetical protein
MRPIFRSRTACAVSLAALSAITMLSAQQRETRERAILVSVSDSADAPITDMTVKDFTVRENDVAREVLRVSPAPPPTHVVLLVDDSQATTSQAQFIRPALTEFIAKIAALNPAPQQSLMTFGERPMKQVDFTPNPERLLEVARRIFPITGSGAYFMQTIVDATRSFEKVKAGTPVIVAFISENGPEFSNELHGQVNDALKRSGASLWAITMQIGPQPGGSSAARERAAVLGDGTRDSGGMNKVVLSAQAIQPAFNTVTNLLTSRYLVTYGRPESLIPPDKIEVTSSRRGVRVRASRWAGR